jgi:hypothetical protein
MLRRPVSWLTSAALLIASAPPMPLRAQPVPAPMPGQAQGQVQLYAAAQLDSILAPIALYPDVLLTQVLMASAFPLQVAEAGRWVQNPGNRQLTGEALAQALVPMDWDPSVKSLVPFPGVLAQLNGNVEWLNQLGYASANQQADVLDSVQRLRHQAQIAGNLRSSPQYIVRTETRYIYIEPVQPNVIYVPAYNPMVVYGAWGYPAYPPVYLVPPMGYGWDPIVGAGLFFGTAVIASALLWDLGRPRWQERNIFVNTSRYNTINMNRTPYRGGEVWQPHQTATFNSGAFRSPPAPVGGGGLLPGQQPRIQGGPGAPGTGVVQPGLQPRAPGAVGTGVVQPGQQPRIQGGPGAAGTGVVQPGLQPRAPGAPGAAGQSGVPAPGLQPRTQGAPGTAGQSGVAAPGLQQPRTPGAPGTAGQSGITPPSQPGQGSLSGGQPGRAVGGPSGGAIPAPSQPRAQGGGGGAPQHVAPQAVAPQQAAPQHVTPQGGGRPEPKRE